MSLHFRRSPPTKEGEDPPDSIGLFRALPGKEGKVPRDPRLLGKQVETEEGRGRDPCLVDPDVSDRTRTTSRGVDLWVPDSGRGTWRRFDDSS